MQNFFWYMYTSCAKRKGGLWRFVHNASKWRRWRNIWRHNWKYPTCNSDVPVKYCNILFSKVFSEKSINTFIVIESWNVPHKKKITITISPLFAWCSSIIFFNLILYYNTLYNTIYNSVNNVRICKNIISEYKQITYLDLFICDLFAKVNTT